MTIILGIKINDRIENAVSFQEVLTEFGCAIKTRIGLHSDNGGVCSSFGIILLEIGDKESAIEIEKTLLNIDEIEIQKMEF